MKKKQKSENSYSPRFELVIQLRDSVGNITGKTKSFTSDSAEEIETFWLKNNTQNNKQHHERSQNKRNKSS